MHVMPHAGGHSPKQANGPTSTSQLKAPSDSGQNSGTSTRGKKRERVDNGAKRERSSRNDEGDSGQCSQESHLKYEISRITEKAGLIDVKGVESLVQLMQPERKMDLVSRTILVNVMANTDKVDCLNGFVERRGLPVLDEWLQDIHKGKIGHSDKSVEEFLLVLLKALDKLPVNLHALQMCNIGRSVNHLRSHKNVEIHRKARTLVDTWKKRVEAEMKSVDCSKSRLPEASHGGSRTPSGSDVMKSSITQNSTSKSSFLRSPEPVKKESQPKTSVGAPQNREDRSSSSYQSPHNSGSVTVNEISRDLKISGSPGISVTGSQKETKSASAHKSNTLEKLSHSPLPTEMVGVGPTSTGSPAADEEQNKMTEDDSKRTTEGFKSNRSKLENLHSSSSFSPMNALIESCARYSEATSSLSLEDDVGMNLLASVAAGEISRSSAVSPANSSERSVPVIEALCNDDQTKPKSSPENCSACEHAVSDGCSCSNNGLHLSDHASLELAGDRECVPSHSSEDAPNEKSNGSASALPVCMENARDGEPDKEIQTTSSNVTSDGIPNCRSFDIHVMVAKDEGGTDNLSKQELMDTVKSEFVERDDDEKLKQTECGQKSMLEAYNAVEEAKVEKQDIVEHISKYHESLKEEAESAGVEPTSIHQPDEEDNEKIMFDLNEDCNADDGKCGESNKTLPFYMNSINGGHFASVAVAAAAKVGGFVPPEDLLKSNVEPGWKGSAATSAFRPAESRKHERISLDFDLNVADERVLEELEPSDSIPSRGSGFLDLDLNRLDETSETGSLNVHRDFDLNDGPVVEDDQISIKQSCSAGIRTSSQVSSWFPPGSSFSTVTIPPVLPDRTEQQPFPVFPGIAPFNPDMIRGSVLSSSPAVPFPSSSFQFPIVPYGTSYPLPSATFPVGATPYPNLQYLGPMGSFSSQFQRPYMVSLPGISNNGGGMDSYRKPSRQGLDLNAAMESEGRDEMVRLSSGQYSVEQARMFSIPGRSILKRTEPPEGSWENESFRNRQFSWQ